MIRDEIEKINTSRKELKLKTKNFKK